MSEQARGDLVARYLAARAAAGDFPGAVWWVERGGRVVSRGAVGAAEQGPASRPVLPTTPYDLASLTKPLCTALLAALLESRGELDLRQPVAGVVPELRRSWLGDKTLVDLACHAAGLPAWRPLCAGGAGITSYLERIALEIPAVPSGRTLYSDLGYIVLGAAVERVAGRPLDRLFRSLIAEPLDLDRIGFARADGAFGDAPPTEQGNRYERAMAGQSFADHGWRRETIRGQVHDANAHGLGGVAGHAGLFGTAGEVAAIGREILSPRRLELADAPRERLLRPIVDGRSAGFVAAAHSRAARGILPDGSPGHTGFTGTSLWLLPDVGGVLVLLTNRVHPRVGSRDFQIVRRGFHRAALRV